jgi:hypothetical protein
VAFKDITKVMYNGKVKIDYKDKAHRYYARPRIDWDLPVDNPKAWGKIMYPKGTTTLLGETLEKKGLMQWPKGVALGELFGFYDFTNDYGERMTGFSKGKGTMWEVIDGETVLRPLDQQESLPVILSASKAWQRDQKKGADIGTVVHDAIEHFIKGQPFDIAEQYLWNIKECEKDFIEGQAIALKKFKPTEKKSLIDFQEKQARDLAEFELVHAKSLEDFEDDVAMATKAFLQFQKWWLETSPTLYGAEDLLYSLEHNVCGTYDGDIGIQAQYHPIFFDLGQKIIRVTADWKTSKASKSEEACMPEGISYDYFVQSAIYEMIRREMGMEPADDLLVVSCRKDGGFTLIYASELGLTVGDCIDWAESTIKCHGYRAKARAGLLKHAEPQLNNQVEAF